MMNRAILYFSLCLLGFGQSIVSFGQHRYLDDVFSEVQITDSVVFSVNYSVYLSIIHAFPDTIIIPQYMDIYEPVGDTIGDRPLILFAITGNFFERIINGEFVGERTDSTNVAFATAMAKKGYVVAVVQYRRGWNPISFPSIQKRSYFQAFYRGVQDLRAAVRYFRKTEAEDNDPWRIDPDKIAVGGTGTGAILSYGASYLDRYDQLLLDKFMDSTTNPPTPFIDTTVLGNLYGTNVANFNNPNYPTYRSDFNMGFALQGALLDGSWVEVDDRPFVAMHAYRDPIIPFDVGDFQAVDPTTNPPVPFALVSNVCGAHAALDSANRLGTQWIYSQIPLGDSISARAAMINEGLEGFYPFITPFTPGDAMCLTSVLPLTEWSIPWSWYDEASAAMDWDSYYDWSDPGPSDINGATAVCINNRGFPNDPVIAKQYMDTVIRFLTPRIFLGLQDIIGTNSTYLDRTSLTIFPNPSKDRVQVVYKGESFSLIEKVQLLDMAGRTIRRYPDINATTFSIEKGNLPDGLYLVQVVVDGKVGHLRIVFH